MQSSASEGRGMWRVCGQVRFPRVLYLAPGPEVPHLLFLGLIDLPDLVQYLSGAPQNVYRNMSERIVFADKLIKIRGPF